MHIVYDSNLAFFFTRDEHLLTFDFFFFLLFHPQTDTDQAHKFKFSLFWN